MGTDGCVSLSLSGAFFSLLLTTILFIQNKTDIGESWSRSSLVCSPRDSLTPWFLQLQMLVVSSTRSRLILKSLDFYPTMSYDDLAIPDVVWCLGRYPKATTVSFANLIVGFYPRLAGTRQISRPDGFGISSVHPDSSDMESPTATCGLIFFKIPNLTMNHVHFAISLYTIPVECISIIISNT